MNDDAARFAELIPAIYRLRDSQNPSGKQPLNELVGLLTEQILALEENLEQLSADHFIETCAEWVIPYIGDLVGCRMLDEKVPGLAGSRAEVANTIRYRRRKGTASMLEQLARDITGWEARVVEFFERLAMTQHMNHVRLPHKALAGLKSASALEFISSPFEPFSRLGEVRSIENGRGTHNIPHIGIFLWRLRPCRTSLSPARNADSTDKRRFYFSPLGNNIPLFTDPQAEEEITHLAEPINVPAAIGRRLLRDHPEDYYGPDRSLFVEGIEGADKVIVCDLSDRGSANDWGPAPPAGTAAVDPVLGRILFGSNQALPPRVTFHSGFSADMGGGEYERQSSFEAEQDWMTVKVPDDYSSLQQALQAVQDQDAVIEITDNGLYKEILTKNFASGQKVEIRAANQKRPLVELKAPFEIQGLDADVILNGLLISGEKIKVGGAIKTLRINHSTLVPGHGLKPAGDPEKPDEPCLEVESGTVRIEVLHSIVGAVRLKSEGEFILADSFLDSTRAAGVALSGPDGQSAAGVLQVLRSTVVGKVHVIFLKLASNSIFCAERTPGDGWTAAVVSKKLQDGCVRFSYVPWESRVPRRYRCQPAGITEAQLIRPRFTTLRYGRPGYGQLHHLCPDEIRRGADDGSEMGGFHDLYLPQRESNLRFRLEEYLRFGLQAGIFYAT